MTYKMMTWTCISDADENAEESTVQSTTAAQAAQAGCHAEPATIETEPHACIQIGNHARLFYDQCGQHHGM